MKEFLSYLYTIDGIPEYAGKGVSERVIKHITYKKRSEWSHHLHSSIAKGRNISIAIWVHDSENEAFKHEMMLIGKYGRRNISTGTLYNQTAGGEGTSGLVWTSEMLKRRSEGHLRSYRENPERLIKLSKALTSYYANEENRQAMATSVSKAQRPKHNLQVKNRIKHALANPILTASSKRRNVVATAKVVGINPHLMKDYFSGKFLDDLK